MAGQPTENALSECNESKGPDAPLRLAAFLGELRLGRRVTAGEGCLAGAARGANQAGAVRRRTPYAPASYGAVAPHRDEVPPHPGFEFLELSTAQN